MLGIIISILVFFSRLDELLNGDEIKIYDLNGNNIVYEVYNKYEVNFNDLTCTNQNVNNKKNCNFDNL